MSQTYCNFCKRPVDARRVIGVGTLILAICTAGFWLLLIPFYGKRCPICKGDSLGDAPPAGADGSPTAETHVRCPDCKELVLKEARVCKHCHAKLIPASEQPAIPPPPVDPNAPVSFSTSLGRVVGRLLVRFRGG